MQAGARRLDYRFCAMEPEVLNDGSHLPSPWTQSATGSQTYDGRLHAGLARSSTDSGQVEGLGGHEDQDFWNVLLCRPGGQAAGCRGAGIGISSSGSAARRPDCSIKDSEKTASQDINIRHELQSLRDRATGYRYMTVPEDQFVELNADLGYPALYALNLDYLRQCARVNRNHDLRINQNRIGDDALEYVTGFAAFRDVLDQPDVNNCAGRYNH